MPIRDKERSGLCKHTMHFSSYKENGTLPFFRKRGNSANCDKPDKYCVLLVGAGRQSEHKLLVPREQGEWGSEGLEVGLIIISDHRLDSTISCCSQ